MRRQEMETPEPSEGGLIPLFNQKRRFPLTSCPSVKDFFSPREYKPNISPATAQSSSPGAYGYFHDSEMSSSTSHYDKWKTQCVPQSIQPVRFDSNRPVPGPAPKKRTYAPITHPYKAGNTSTSTRQPGYPVQQKDSSFPTVPHNKYPAPPSNVRAPNKPTANTPFSSMGQQSSYRTPTPISQYSQQSGPLPPPVPSPSQNDGSARPQKTWKFTRSFGPESCNSDGKNNLSEPKTAPPIKTKQEAPIKPAFEMSLRILTAVIDGMRYWSQYKDKVPYLFEIFATLDSAVTVGHHGAKTFRLRDGKEAVQCIFYENERELPRLIRGQVHRCIGNYDRSTDTVVCVSVRPGLPSELRNAQEAVKACDAEMRTLIKVLSEV